MINYDYIEFSKIYKRVMDVELKIKRQYKIALKIAYPNKMFYRLIPYLKNRCIGRYMTGKDKARRDKIKDLIASKKSEEEKMNKFIDMAYLSDLVTMLTEYKLLYQNVKFTDNFYRTTVNFNDIKKYGSILKSLRNKIMHFQIIDYKQSKIDNLNALEFWEKILLCENCFMYKIQVPSPTIKNILQGMKDHCPDFDTANDRYLCDVFDDIAFINGVSVDKLPKYWSIGRQIYNFKEN